MRLITVTKLLMFGGAAALVTSRLGNRRSKPAAPARDVAGPPRFAQQPAVTTQDLAFDMGDPVPQFADLQDVHFADLDVDAISNEDAEAAQDLMEVSAELDAARFDDDDVPPEMTIRNARNGSGELYGIHTPTAVDRDLPDGDASYNQGENWLEALEASAAEHGLEPEQELDIVDDNELATHSTDTRDRPIADLGAAGPRGM